MTKLSILICTLPEPRNQEYLKRLMQILQPQAAPYGSDIEIKIHDAPRSMLRGTKRNELIKISDGEYFSFIDDDDRVPMYYVDELMKAISQGPDVITFVGWMSTDGQNRTPFTIKLGEKYEERQGRYYRYPNHLCCFKRSTVEQIKFRDIHVQEDYFWATEIRDKGLLKTEVHIPHDMYFYEFVSNKDTGGRISERRGQNRVIVSRRTKLR